jgi:hypothetical protein
MTRRAALGALLYLASLPAHRLHAQAGVQQLTPLRLVSCGEPATSGCLETRLALPLRPDRGGIDELAQRDSAVWSLDLGGMAYPTAVEPAPSLQPPLRLLVLLDVSGSMAGEGMAFTRAALGEFLAGLDSGGVLVALAPFESRGVAARIRSAAFENPRAAAVTLQQLPAPDRRGNTALFSAVSEGLTALDAAVARSPGARGALIVVTDGQNDVSGAGDDRGLLVGESGLRATAATIGASGHSMWLIGAGDQVAESELKMLAGSSGEPYIVRMDPVAMSWRLRAVGRRLRYTREVVAYVGAGARSSLARGEVGEIRVRSGADSIVVARVVWRPPLLSVPAYHQPSVLAARIPQSLTEAGEQFEVPRWLVVLSVGLLTAVLWWVLPLVAWRVALPGGGPGSPPRNAAPIAARPEPPAAVHAAGPAMAHVAPGRVRPDVREAPARSPADITNQSARRLDR